MTSAVIDRFRGPHFFLSNMSSARIQINGLTYASSEHLYQTGKTEDPEWQEKIRTAATPWLAKRYSNQCPRRPDWDDMKVDVMRFALHEKFRQNPILAAKLLATNDALLIEGNFHHDRVWGVYCGEGLNWLGRLLMQLRMELRAASR